MKRHAAIRRTQNGSLIVELVPTLHPGPGEVLVAPEIAGICGTDIQILQGLRNDPARVLGHEGIGRVIAAGAGVRTMREGQRVTFNPTHPIRHDLILGHTYDGVWQEAVLIPADALHGGVLIPIPESVPAKIGPLIEPFAAMLYSYELLCEAAPAMRHVAIFGLGTIAVLFAIYLERLIEGPEYSVVYRDEKRAQWLAANGVVPAERLRSIDSLASRHDSKLTLFFDAAVIASSRRFALQDIHVAAAAIANHGCIDLFGGFPEGARAEALPDVDLGAIRRANSCGQPVPGLSFQTWTRDKKPLCLVGHRGVSAAHIHSAYEALTKNYADYRPVLSTVESLEEAAVVLDRVRLNDRTIDGKPWLKLAIDFRPASQARALKGFP